MNAVGIFLSCWVDYDSLLAKRIKEDVQIARRLFVYKSVILRAVCFGVCRVVLSRKTIRRIVNFIWDINKIMSQIKLQMSRSLQIREKAV